MWSQRLRRNTIWLRFVSYETVLVLKVQRSHTLHITDPRPPMATKAPVQAHERLECMSFGVMSSKHNPGSVPAGMTKDNWFEVLDVV